jgi:uncharacterized membrane protein
MLTLPRGAALPHTDGPFDLVAGLPMHPLVVHVAVVILPLSALALIALVLVPRLRRPFGWLTLAGLAAGAVAAYVAKESGEALADRVGLPTEHADYGTVLPVLAVILLLVAAGWYVLQRRDAARQAGSSPATIIAGIAAILLAVATTVLTVLVGHTGATAAWSDVVGSTSTSTSTSTAATASAATPTPVPTTSGGTGASSGAAATSTPQPLSSGGSPNSRHDPKGIFTLPEVATHADQSSCWAAIDAKVYDLTGWINRHPGGPSRILALCGTDATAAFNAQHGGQARPKAELATFAIGRLSGPRPATN